jgi:acyl-CoA thioesterase-1
MNNAVYHILFFGNSLTAGYGLRDASNESFPALIQQKINKSGLPFEVINAGISGDTSAGGLYRLDYWLSRPIRVFVLELGINDMMRGIPPPVTFRNLEAIIIKVKARYPDCKLALMGMELPRFVPGPAASAFRSIFRKLADTYHLAFFPFFLEGVAGVPHLNLTDGIHPSAKGYQIIADRVWPVLKPLLSVG